MDLEAIWNVQIFGNLEIQAFFVGYESKAQEDKIMQTW